MIDAMLITFLDTFFGICMETVPTTKIRKRIVRNYPKHITNKAQSRAASQGPHYRRRDIDVDHRRQNRVSARERPQGNGSD